MISYAVCRELPQSFVNCVTAVDLNQSPIDIDLAHQQHDAYVQVLKQHVKEVIQVAADEAHPGNDIQTKPYNTNDLDLY